MNAPDIKAARVAVIEPSNPCALRKPNSKTESPVAALHTRYALVATNV